MEVSLVYFKKHLDRRDSMRITELETRYTDIMWFAVDKLGNILECTSGIYGNIPEFVCF